jgi:hypothetical protein
VGNALNTFLKMEELGSPIEAAELGRPVNGLEPVGEQNIVDVYPRDVMEQHVRLVRWFEEAERSSQNEREQAERDRDYYDGAQLTPAELAALKKRGQPPLIDNYIRDKVDLLCGMERKARTDPVAYPRTPQEEDRADAATQALRYLQDDVVLPQIRSSVWENMLIEGIGGAELGLEDDGKGGANITLTHVAWDRLFRDPHSRNADCSDSRYHGIVAWMDRDQLEEMYPNAGDVLEEAFASTGQGGTYGDRPGVVAWQDSTRERCRVVQVYWKEGANWWGATITKTGFLAEPWRSPFKDRKRRSACPLRLRSAYVNRDNERYGVVRDLVTLQDAINKRQSKALHQLSVSRIKAPVGALDDIDKARREAAKPDGVIIYNPIPGMEVQIESGADLAMGQFKLHEIAISRMQAKGPNAAMQGNDPRDLSGRAILAQQAGGAAANEPLADGLRQWTRELYEIMWMAVREYWRGQRWLRVTDDLGKLKFVGINRQITLADRLAEMPEEMRGMALQRLGMVPNDPRLQQVVGTENDISDLEVDITIEEGNDIPALQAEQFQQLAQLASSMPGVIPPEVLIRVSSLKDKAEILDMLKEHKEQAAQVAQQQAPMAQAAAQAEVAVKQTQAQLNEARANDLQHTSVERIARVHREAAESPALPVDGPGIQPQAPQQGF